MTNGEPAYSVIVTKNENRTFIQGYAYMKMSAKDYINSIPITYEQYTDPAVQPDEIPDHLRIKPKKGKKGKQKQRKKALKTMCQERGPFSIKIYLRSSNMTRRYSMILKFGL